MAVSSASKLLTISRITANQAVDLGFEEAHIVHLPVSRRFWPQMERISSNEANFLFVGNVDARKGVLDAVRALSEYRGEARGTFRIVGSFRHDDLYCQEVLAAANQCDHFQIEILGQISQEALADEFRRASIFLFPSYWEGYGIAVEEAMCFGLPVVAYASGSIPELVTDGFEGWVVPTGDVGALARAIAECLDHPSLRATRSRQALLKAKALTSNGTPGETAIRVARGFLSGVEGGNNC